MSEELTIRILSMQEYFGATLASRDYIVPSVPAIYFWFINFRKFSSIDEKKISEIQNLIQKGTRNFDGRLEPYYWASVKDSAKPLSDDRIRKLKEIHDLDVKALSWIFLCSTVFQRPLYVGQTVNLSQRLKAHTAPGSRLSSYLLEAGLGFSDCSLAYVLSSFIDFEYIEYIDEEEPILSEDDDQGGMILDVLESIITRLSKPSLARKQD